MAWRTSFPSKFGVWHHGIFLGSGVGLYAKAVKACLVLDFTGMILVLGSNSGVHFPLFQEEGVFPCAVLPGFGGKGVVLV